MTLPQSINIALTFNSLTDAAAFLTKVGDLCIGGTITVNPSVGQTAQQAPSFQTPSFAAPAPAVHAEPIPAALTPAQKAAETRARKKAEADALAMQQASATPSFMGSGQPAAAPMPNFQPQAPVAQPPVAPMPQPFQTPAAPVQAPVSPERQKYNDAFLQICQHMTNTGIPEDQQYGMTQQCLQQVGGERVSLLTDQQMVAFYNNFHHVAGQACNARAAAIAGAQ